MSLEGFMHIVLKNCTILLTAAVPLSLRRVEEEASHRPRAQAAYCNEQPVGIGVIPCGL